MVNNFGAIQKKNLTTMLSNIQQIISADQALTRINNTLRGEIVDLQGGIISSGRPLCNAEGQAAIMNAVGLIVNERVTLGQLDDHDIMADTIGFGEALTFLVGVHGSELGVHPKDIFALVTGCETLVHAHLTGARKGITLKNLTQQISIIDQKVSNLDERKKQNPI